MAEYIEREALIEFIKQNTPNINGETSIKCVDRAIRAVPVADVVEVVRCKDCEYAKEYKNNLFCCYYPRAPKSVSSNDYCSYGIRKDGDE